MRSSLSPGVSAGNNVTKNVYANGAVFETSCSSAPASGFITFNPAEARTHLRTRHILRCLDASLRYPAIATSSNDIESWIKREAGSSARLRPLLRDYVQRTRGAIRRRLAVVVQRSVKPYQLRCGGGLALGLRTDRLWRLDVLRRVPCRGRGLGVDLHCSGSTLRDWDRARGRRRRRLDEVLLRLRGLEVALGLQRGNISGRGGRERRVFALTQLACRFYPAPRAVFLLLQWEWDV